MKIHKSESDNKFKKGFNWYDKIGQQCISSLIHIFDLRYMYLT